MACRPGFLFDVLSHVGGDRMTRKEYDAGYYFIGADNILTKEEWDAGWLLVDLDLDGFISRSKLRGAYLHPLRPIIEFSSVAALFVIKVFSLFIASMANDGRKSDGGERCVRPDA